MEAMNLIDKVEESRPLEANLSIGDKYKLAVKY